MASIRFVDDCGRKRRSVAYAKTQKLARHALRQMQLRIEQGDTAIDSSTLLSVWCERWISSTLRASARRPTTQQTYASLIRVHVIPALGHIKLKDLTTAHVEDLVIDMASRRAASTTRQTHLVLVMALDSAVKHGLLRRNVAKDVDRPPRTRSAAHYFTSSTVAQIRSSAAGHRLEPFLALTVYTGLRKGEALALRWCDVELMGPHPHLRVAGTLSRIGTSLTRTEPKTASGRRVVPLVPAALEALQRARVQQAKERLAAGVAWTDTGFVFTTELGTPVDPRNALRWFYGVRDAAARELMRGDSACGHDDAVVASGLPCPRCGRCVADYARGSLHTLRHSAASVLLASGVPMPIVRDILGHSSIAVTVDMYGHMAPVLVAEAMTAGMVGYGMSS